MQILPNTPLSYPIPPLSPTVKTLSRWESTVLVYNATFQIDWEELTKVNG